MMGERVTFRSKKTHSHPFPIVVVPMLSHMEVCLANEVQGSSLLIGQLGGLMGAMLSNKQNAKPKVLNAPVSGVTRWSPTSYK